MASQMPCLELDSSAAWDILKFVVNILKTTVPLRPVELR
jgi:hypothetical protein